MRALIRLFFRLFIRLFVEVQSGSRGFTRVHSGLRHFVLAAFALESRLNFEEYARAWCTRLDGGGGERYHHIVSEVKAASRVCVDGDGRLCGVAAVVAVASLPPHRLPRSTPFC